MLITHFCVLPEHRNRGDEAIRKAIQDIFAEAVPGSRIITKNIRTLRGGSILRFIQAIKQSDLVIIGGGGIFSDFFMPFRRAHLCLMIALRKPYIFCGPGLGVNINTFLSDNAAESIRVWCKKAKVNLVRDEVTLRFLNKLGIANAYCVGDPALFLQAKYNRAEKRKRIGINIAYHGWEGHDNWLPKLLNTITDIARHFSERGYEILYMKHSNREEYVISKLREKIPLVLRFI